MDPARLPLKLIGQVTDLWTRAAVQWVDSGISVWFFPRNSIPSDLSAGAPQPDGWGTPMAHWPATNCNPSQFFSDHSAIFDTTLW